MRIPNINLSDSSSLSKLEELELLLESRPLQDPVCGNDCTRFKEAPCHRTCSDAPSMLSCDGNEYPLDNKIAPLAFELKRTGFFAPCWSCEGHLNNFDELWKLPRIWFYCESSIHIKLLDAALHRIRKISPISTMWEIKSVHLNDGSLDPMFSLQPDLQAISPSLSSLQQDIDIISEHIYDALQHEARNLCRSHLNVVGSSE